MQTCRYSNEALLMFNRLYIELIQQEPKPIDKLGSCLLSEFNSVCEKDLEIKIRKMSEKIPEFIYTIKENRDKIPFYDQGIVIFIVYLFYRHYHQLIRDWPIDHEIMRKIASNLGISLDN